MFKILRRLFKRKKYAPIYQAGGYPNPTDLYSMARSGEMVVSTHQAIKRLLNDTEDVKKHTVECSETFDIPYKVAEAIEKNLEALQRKQHTNCPNCGAPLHGHKCDYCGTEP